MTNRRINWIETAQLMIYKKKIVTLQAQKSTKQQ